MTLPTVLVEVAFATAPDDPLPVWVDVTQWTRVEGISLTRGRLDEFSEIQPSHCSLTLINSDGRFTAGNVDSPYYPNVKKGRRLRVSVTWDSVVYRRLTGYVDEWPVTWADASATVADAPISATSRLSRLGRGVELRSIVEEEYLLDEPVAYYPLGEPEGATQAGNVSTTSQPVMTVGQTGSGGTLTFGTATGPGTDGLSAPTFTRVDANNGKYLTATPNGLDNTADTAMLMEAFFNTSTAARVSVCSLTTPAGTSGETIELYVEPGGQLVGRHRANGATDTGGFEIFAGADVNDGATHHAALKLTVSGGAVTGELFRDGVSIATSSAETDITLFSATNFSVGGGSGLVPFNGTISHAAVYRGSTEVSDARVDSHYDAGATGFSGERSDQRIARLAGYAGVPSGEVSTETGLSTSMAAQVTNDRTAIELMREVENTEGGLLFDARDGVLTFHARSHRYNTASTLTLSGDVGELVPPLEPRLDDQGLVNDMTATREGGVSARAVDPDSITDYGLYRTSVQLFTTSDNEVQDAANWKIFTASVPQVRIPVAVADLELASSAQKTALLTLEIGDRITLSGLPSQAPAASMDFFIEGYTEQITAVSHRIAFNLSPASLSGVWQLDSSTYSVLGSTTRLGY